MSSAQWSFLPGALTAQLTEPERTGLGVRGGGVGPLVVLHIVGTWKCQNTVGLGWSRDDKIKTERNTEGSLGTVSMEQQFVTGKCL